MAAQTPLPQDALTWTYRFPCSSLVPPAGPCFLLAGQDQVAEVPGIRREGRTPLGHSWGVGSCKINIKLMWQRECGTWRWKVCQISKGAWRSWALSVQVNGEVVVIIVGDNGILVHMHARANRGQTAPNFTVENHLISLSTCKACWFILAEVISNSLQ